MLGTERSIPPTSFALLGITSQPSIKITYSNVDRKLNMKIIDFENHFFDPKTVEALAARRPAGDIPYYVEERKGFQWTPNCWHFYGPLLDKLIDFDERVALMDKRGIDVAVLSSAHGFEQLGEKSAEVCRQANDLIYSVMQKYPGRFMGTACLPVFDTEAAVAELERVVKEYGFIGWHTHSNYGTGKPQVHDERFWPIWKKAEELGVYIYLHPHFPDMDHLNNLGASIIGAGMGFTLDTMIEVGQILCSSLLDKYPGTKILLGHYGEAIPFLLERMENRFALIPNESIKCSEPLSHYFRKNIWVDTSGNTSVEAFKCTKEVLGMDHILLGTDHPFETLDDMMDAIEALPLTEDERKMLYHENAEVHLGIKF